MDTKIQFQGITSRLKKEVRSQNKTLKLRSIYNENYENVKNEIKSIEKSLETTREFYLNQKEKLSKQG